MCAQPLQPRRIVHRVGLVRRHDDGLVLQALARGVASGEKRQLARDHREVLDRIASLGRRDVDDVHEHARALEMAEEAVAEAVPLVRPFDQARHVGDDERAVAESRRRRGWARAW
jgi:hypothetical protein